jgi:tRNA A-37 threonylcarbamoyl transferase component Bud32
MGHVALGDIERWLVERSASLSCSGHARWVAKGPVAVRDNSRVFFAECQSFPFPLAVKLCFRTGTAEPDPETAERQFEALRRVWLQMSQDGGQFSVPRPYLLEKETGLLAMEWVTGTSMTQQLFSWRCDSTLAHECMVRAGHWLRRFHAARHLPPTALDVEHKLSLLSEIRGIPIEDRTFSQALKCLRQSATAAGSPPLERSWIHGDFKTDNLVLSGRRVVGIDLHLRHENTVVHDMAPFLNHLELQSWHPGGWRLFAGTETLRKSFLGGYFGGLERAIDLPLAWLQLFTLLFQWESARIRSGSWLHSRFIDLCHRSVARRLFRRLRL